MNKPPGYSDHRLHKTWTEKHPLTDKQERRAQRRSEKKAKNRLPGHFGKANWEAYQHYEMYNMIMKAEPQQMYRRAEQWKQLSAAIEETTSQVQDAVQKAMGIWQGQAAVNAGASTSRLMQWAGTASHTASRVAENMSSYTDAVQTAQRNMPPPAFATAERNFRDGYTVKTTGGPADAIMLRQLTTDGMVAHEEARARKAEAVQVMETYESHSREVHRDMPHFEDAGPTTKPAPAFTPRPDGAGAGGAGGGGGFPSTTPSPVAGSGAGSPAGNSSTSAAGFVDPSFGPGGTGPGGGGPGSQGLTGFGGPGSLNGNGDAIRTGGGFGAGFPGGAGGAGGASALGPGALAARGAGGVIGGPGGMAAGAGARGAGAGAFGGMPFGAGANGEENGEHTNKYDEGLDLFDDLPPAYPPVFGA
jgi:PPE family